MTCEKTAFGSGIISSPPGIQHTMNYQICVPCDTILIEVVELYCVPGVCACIVVVMHACMCTALLGG